MLNKQFYFIYKITNTLTGKIYIGAHSTNDINDGYLGSGKHIKRAIKKYGKENFKKEIIEYFDNEVNMYAREAEIVNEEFTKSTNNYNISLGGHGGNTGAYDSEHRSMLISNASKGKVVVKDESGKSIKISISDKRYNTTLFGVTTGLTTTKDKEGNIHSVKIDDSRLTSGELVGITKGLAMMRDELGNVIQVSVSDDRIATGELVGVTAGIPQKESSNRKRSATQKGRSIKWHTRVSCVKCKKTTILTNLIRWCYPKCHDSVIDK